MKRILKNKLIKKLCIMFFFIYVLVIFINQQQTINSYNSQKKYYATKISDAKKENADLNLTKDNLDSKEYIESISREKLDMYSENERVYININK